MREARHDPYVGRFSPDEKLIVRAQRRMLADEDDDPRARFLRQRWEEAYGAVRVALQALREIYPSERDVMIDGTRHRIREALGCLLDAYAQLDDATERIVGPAMFAVLTGAITDVQTFDKVYPPDDHQ